MEIVMTWTIDEARIQPFLTAAERRDVLARLARPGRHASSGLALSTALQDPAVGSYKEGKESKDYKDKEGKESKDYKDNKDGKDFKDGKEIKDNKDNKDNKDSTDFSPMPSGQAHPREPSPACDDPAARVPDDLSRAVMEGVLATLRRSRASRFLRGSGIVI
jgi:hypothetical protein